uniref:Rho guanine nucleotide exchange factor 15 n=1 Tax=Peromyscus maniculatus bairdii TaxID=230844 RepID=A0A8C8UDI1_PERMB
MQESLFEVVTSEASYLRSLRLLTDTFVLSRALRDTLTPRDHHTLFSNVQRVQGVSERFLGTLLSRVRSSPHISDLCDVVHAHAVGPFSVYVDYVRNQQYQEETYSRLMDTNVRFSAELRRLQSLPKCERLPLPSFLLLPFQRITRLRMLLQVLSWLGASGLVITISYPTVTTDILSGQLSQPQLPKCLRGRKEPSRLSWAQPLTS